ncbi:MAG: class I SAM-dependent methyltransferase [Desulfobacterales bacterium]|jgi:ubiquinone/menaquinone biosynthesis C-methylase UbiE
MPRYKSTPFDDYHGRYEAWFQRHPEVYHSELLAVRAFLPWQGLGLEIGIGTGRFAAPLGIKVGLDPSRAMLAYALKRGGLGIQGVAEALPFKNSVFDYGLIITTICFVDEPKAMLNEARRVLKPGAPLIIGFVDRASVLGQQYLTHQAESVFYREARFYSVSEVERLLDGTGFVGPVCGQTLSKPLNKIQEIEPLRDGHGHGGFVVVKAVRH